MRMLILPIEQVAAICHAANREYCALSLGDESHRPWDETPRSLREGVINRVYLACQGMGPEAWHEQWMSYKAAAGWVYGEDKDETAKTDPDMVPYTRLPRDVQRKNKLFHAIVAAFFVP